MLDEIINDEFNNEQYNLKSKDKTTSPLLKLFNQRFVQYCTVEPIVHTKSLFHLSSEYEKIIDDCFYVF